MREFKCHKPVRLILVCRAKVDASDGFNFMKRLNMLCLFVVKAKAINWFCSIMLTYFDTTF